MAERFVVTVAADNLDINRNVTMTDELGGIS